MTCEECRTALSAEIDGEEAAPAPGAVRGHLAGCAGCGRWLAAAWRLEELLGGAAGPRW